MFNNGRQVRLQMFKAVPVKDGDSRLMLIDMRVHLGLKKRSSGSSPEKVSLRGFNRFN